MTELLGLHEEGKIEPEPVMLGPMPRNASRPMRAVAADMERRIGLLLCEGFQTVLPYALSVPVGLGIVSSKRMASHTMNRLLEAGVIDHVGEAPARGKGNGTSLYVPAGWRPFDPKTGAVLVEGRWEGRAASLVWAMDEAALVGGAVEPSAEDVDDLLVGHNGKPTDPVGIREEGLQ